MALTISTGFVVDDAIVMIENIARYIEEGYSPLEAALKGSEQIGFTIVSLTVSLIAVLIPLLFMGDIVGRLFREFAVTLGVTILVSAFVSLTLTPMMCVEASAPGRGITPREVLYGYRSASSSAMIDVLRKVAAIGSAAPDDHADRYGRHLGADAFCSTITSPRVFSRCRIRASFWEFRRRRRRFRFPPWRRASRLSPRVILEGSGRCQPVVVYRRGRHQYDAEQRPHPDQPEAARGAQVHRFGHHPPACSLKLANVQGITLFMQPVQDLTVEDRVSRTQYQYSI